MGSNEAAIAAYESVWLDANRYYEAESRYIEVSAVELRRRANPGSPPSAALSSAEPGMSQSSLASEIALARQRIQNFLKSDLEEFSCAADHFDNVFGSDETESATESCAISLEDHFRQLRQGQEKLQKKVSELDCDATKVYKRLSALEKSMDTVLLRLKGIENALKGEISGVQNGSPQAADNDDDLDLFGSDEEVDNDAAKLREERLQAYANKKAKKPALVAKSSVILDVKPWDDETDLKAMEKAVRGITADGLVWGASKLVPLAYGIKKLQIVAVVEDEKVSIDWLQEAICEMEDLVQSVDIASFNKL